MLHDRSPDRRELWLDNEDLAALKTWLGRRYDRPAVPVHLADVMKAISAAVDGLPDNDTVNVRRLFARFSASNPPRFNLYALINADGDGKQIEEDISGAMLSVSEELGILDEVQALKRDQMTLETIETSFEVDASDITWRGGSAHGAH